MLFPFIHSVNHICPCISSKLQEVLVLILIHIEFNTYDQIRKKPIMDALHCHLEVLLHI